METESKFSEYSLSAKVCEPLVRQIIEMIQQGQLRPGEKLPPQDVLAKELGVSRTSLREVLKELSYRGLIYCRHGVGTFICNSSVTELEVLEVRKYLETGTAFLAALRATPQDIERLSEFVKEMEKSLSKGDLGEFSTQDFAFHFFIIKLTGNKVFHKIFQALEDLVLQQQNTVQKLPGAAERAHGYHKRIVESIAARNTSFASKVMADHLQDVANALSLSIKEKERS